MTGEGFDSAEYVTVAERLALFRDRYPDGSLQPVNPSKPFRVVAVLDGQMWIVYAAAAYRTPDDPRPGIGTAYEPVPGPTAFTRGSELQNAETAAWGRAIASLGIGTRRGVASADDMRAAARRREQPGPRRASADDLASIRAGLDQLDLDDAARTAYVARAVGDVRASELTDVQASALLAVIARDVASLAGQPDDATDTGTADSPVNRETAEAEARAQLPAGQVQRATGPADDDPWTTPDPAAQADPLTGQLPPDPPPARLDDDGRPVPMVSDAQQRLLGVLTTRAGLTDRADRLAFAAGIVGRDLATSRDLTHAEASAVIDALQAAAREADAQPESSQPEPGGPS